MKRISSKGTFFHKRVFPVIIFGLLGIILCVMLFSSRAQNIVPFLLGIIAISVFGFVIMKKLVLDLIDEVYDDGPTLLLINSKQKARISLSDIKNVSYSYLQLPPRVTLSLRTKSAFGNEISFMPQIVSLIPLMIPLMIPLKKNPYIQELIDRIDKARQENINNS